MPWFQQVFLPQQLPRPAWLLLMSCYSHVRYPFILSCLDNHKQKNHQGEQYLTCGWATHLLLFLLLEVVSEHCLLCILVNSLQANQIKVATFMWIVHRST